MIELFKSSMSQKFYSYHFTFQLFVRHVHMSEPSTEGTIRSLIADGLFVGIISNLLTTQCGYNVVNNIVSA